VTFAGLVENLPLAEGTVKSRGVTIGAEGEQDGHAQAVQVRDKTGAGMEVRFSAPQALRIQRNGPKINELQIGRVEVTLPAQLAAGQTVELTYTLRALAPPA
jgi:hypothetical protein